MAQTAKLHDRYPELGRGPVPVAPYVDPAYYELEKKYLFRKTWLHVGRVEELPKVGDYMVKELKACDASIVIARDRNKQLHAFHNVCSHRLNKIAYEPYGNQRKFFCKFHGWAYELNGDLSGVPDEKAFMDFDKKCHGLTKVALDTWNGFIFINLDPKPTMSLKEFMSPLFEGFESYPFERFTACYSWSAVVDCNWKVALDAFQETYHVAYLHGRSIASSLETDEEGILHPIDAILGDHHRRLSIAGNPNTVYGNPAAATEHSHGGDHLPGAATSKKIAHAALRAGRNGTKLDFSDVVLPEKLNWTKNPNWAFDINVIFPEFYLSCRPNYYQAYNFRPVGHNKTLFEARVFYPEMKTAGGRFYQEYMKTALRDVLLEDLSTLETTQYAAETSGKTEMILNDWEIALRHQAVIVDKIIEEGLRRDGQLAAE